MILEVHGIVAGVLRMTVHYAGRWKLVHVGNSSGRLDRWGDKHGWHRLIEDGQQRGLGLVWGWHLLKVCLLGGWSGHVLFHCRRRTLLAGAYVQLLARLLQLPERNDGCRGILALTEGRRLDMC
jgi:hypothetical protein